MRHAPRRILAIDDHPDNLALLEALLSRRQMAVLTAMDGETGLTIAKAEAKTLAAIVLDLAMPGLDGFGVLEALRKDPVTRALPVVVLTASYREPALIERGLALGATEYLTKPIHPEELFVRLTSAIRLAEAERALASMREQFSAMLAHDLRAPLDAAALAMRAIARRAPEGAPERQLSDQAVLALGMARDLIDGLLETHRLDAGDWPVVRARFDLAAVARHVGQVLRPLAEAKGLELAVEAPEVRCIVGDENLARRAAENLVANALKATEHGFVRLEVSGPEATPALAVVDSGPGFAVTDTGDTLGRHVAVGERRRADAGYGLGLAFCERAMRQQGGSLTIDSRPGHGSRVSLFWPEEVPA